VRFLQNMAGMGTHLEVDGIGYTERGTSNLTFMASYLTEIFKRFMAKYCRAQYSTKINALLANKGRLIIQVYYT